MWPMTIIDVRINGRVRVNPPLTWWWVNLRKQSMLCKRSSLGVCEVKSSVVDIKETLTQLKVPERLVGDTEGQKIKKPRCHLYR